MNSELEPGARDDDAPGIGGEPLARLARSRELFAFARGIADLELRLEPAAFVEGSVEERALDVRDAARLLPRKPWAEVDRERRIGKGRGHVERPASWKTSASSADTV
jgi:hypothetical protein